jgi:putative peptide zinc metalloprotease protein
MAVVDARLPTRAPGVELLGPLRDSGYTEARWVVRRPDGQMIQVTSLLYSLLEAVDGRRDLAELAGELTRACGKAVEPEDIELLLTEKLAPLGLLCAADGAPPPARKPVPLLALRWKFVVTDPASTGRLTAPFTALFRRSIVVPVLVAFVATTWWVLFRRGLASGLRQAFDSPGLLLAAFALVLVSAGWHEFGHAAACRAAGARPGAMGAGLYMVWPAFYTDVDDSRRLSRGGRLVVDLGGLYFNAVAAVAVMAVWLVVRADALLLVVAGQHLLMVRQLAPVIRADGYHILSDLVGVPDLFQHIKPTLAGMLPNNWGKPQPLRPMSRWVVRAWVLLVVPLLLWLFVLGVLLLPRLVATAWAGVDEHGGAVLSRSGDGDLVGALAAVLKTASLVLPVAATTYMLTRVVRRTARRVWSSTEGRPVARAGVSAVAAALALFLAVAWWPAGQYKPVSADENLTFTNLLNTRTVAEPEFRPIAGVRPMPGYALVPRGDSDASAMLVTRTEDGSLQAILTDEAATSDGAGKGVTFPFGLPAAPGEGDTQALAVNTGDGTVVYDVAVAMIWVKDGAPADNRNEAYALASCTACTTVAVSFQVVLIVGQTDVVAPVNVAVAANGGCVSCTTTALAVQLVVTLREMPSEELQERMDAALARIDTELTESTDLDRLYAEVQAVQAEIVAMLADAGLIAGVPPSSTTASTVATTSTTIAGSSSSSTSTTTTSTTSLSSGEPTTTTTTASTTTTTERSTTTTTTTSP